MAYRVKKFRGYRRMLKKLMRVVEDYQPNWRPDEADGREEFLELDLYAHRFFHPRGKDRKALFSALLRKTEALIAAKPAELPFCKIFLFVPEGDLGQAEIVLIYDRERFETFWLRTDPADERWTLQRDRSLLTELGLSNTLPERCVLEEYPIPWIEGCVERALIWGYGELSPVVAEPDGAKLALSLFLCEQTVNYPGDSQNFFEIGLDFSGG